MPETSSPVLAEGMQAGPAPALGICLPWLSRPPYSRVYGHHMLRFEATSGAKKG